MPDGCFDFCVCPLPSAGAGLMININRIGQIQHVIERGVEDQPHEALRGVVRRHRAPPEAAVLRTFEENEKQYGYAFATLLDRTDKDKVHVIAPLTDGFSYHLLPVNYDFGQQLPTGPYQGNPVDWPHELFASLAEATEHRADR